MLRFALPAASVACVLVAIGVLAGLLPLLPTTPLAAVGLLLLCVLAAVQPQWQLFGPALVRAHSPGRVALTFDDGPDPEGTPAVLDALDAAGMQATFFVVGERARQHPALVRDIAARGHEVGNHSMHHRWPAIMSRRGAAQELDEAQALLAGLLGTAPSLYRPPIGLVSPFVFEAAQTAGVALATWSLRTFDGKNPATSALLQRLERVQAGDVVLLHDGRGPHGQLPAAESIDGILRSLQDRGLISTTMSDLFDGALPCSATRARATGRGVHLALALLIASALLA